MAPVRIFCGYLFSSFASRARAGLLPCQILFQMTKVKRNAAAGLVAKPSRLFYIILKQGQVFFNQIRDRQAIWASF